MSFHKAYTTVFQLNQGLQIIKDFLRFSSREEDDAARLVADYDVNSVDELCKAADKILELQEIADGLDITGADIATKSINDKAEFIESQLLDNFEKASERSNYAKMKKCAETLLRFKSRKVMSRYHHNVLKKLPMNQEASTGSSVDEIETLYWNVISTCREEVAIIIKVFPEPVRVFKNLLLKRIIPDRIGSALDDCLDEKKWKEEEYLDVCTFLV